MILDLLRVVDATRQVGKVKTLMGAFVLSVCMLTAVLVPGMAMAMPSETPFEIVPGSFRLVPSTGQAAAHEDLVTSFDFAHNAKGQTYNDVRNIIVNLPPGFDGNNTAVPTCTQTQLIGLQLEEGSTCPPASQVGTISLDIVALESKSGPVLDTFPVYNMEVTSYGVTAELGFKTIAFSATLLVSVRPGDSGLTISTLNIQKQGEAHNVTVTIWGLPASKIHDPERGQECWTIGPPSTLKCFKGGESANYPVKPFLSNPTSCGSFTATMKADSWEEPENWSEATDSEVGPIGECDRVPFEPVDRSAADDALGGIADRAERVDARAAELGRTRFAISTSNLKDVEVHAARGHDGQPIGRIWSGCVHAGTVRIGNAVLAAGRGLSAGIEDRVDRNRNAGAGGKDPGRDLCRHSPTTTRSNRSSWRSLLALYIVAKDPARGIIVKVAGQDRTEPCDRPAGDDV